MISEHILENLQMPNGAIFSPCQRWRYLLWRRTEAALYPGDRGTLLALGINPSDANASRDDHTLRKVVGFARKLNYGRAMIANPFAWVSKDLHSMLALEVAGADVIGPENDAFLRLAMSQADVIVPCWGKHGSIRGRDMVLLDMAREAGKPISVFAINADGTPSHPARLPYGRLVPYLHKKEQQQ